MPKVTLGLPGAYKGYPPQKTTSFLISVLLTPSLNPSRPLVPTSFRWIPLAPLAITLALSASAQAPVASHSERAAVAPPTAGQTRLAPEARADSVAIRKMFDEALAHGASYENLRTLCKQIGPRLSGSAGAQKAVEWGQAAMRAAGADSVWLQPCMVPHWERGKPESARVLGVKGLDKLPVCALGGSVPTAGKLVAPVVEVQNFEELAALPADKVKGHIVLFNRPMEARNVTSFTSYGGAVNQRGRGAIEAAKRGAVGVLVRSMNLRADDFPHTGAMRYQDDVTKIPAAAISTNAADQLSAALKKQPDIRVELKMDCRTLPDAPSFNVVGEIRGSELPKEVIVVGGHLDSWDLAEGAHDDGAGCVQSIEVLRLLKATGQRPRRSVRAVLFMNEENGTRGAQEYANQAEKEVGRRRHIAAIESDAGGFTPRGFTVQATPAQVATAQQWRPLLKPYLVDAIEAGHSGTDIEPLGKTGAVLLGLSPDSQRYFDVHHAATDVFEAVNRRELELGGATMGAMVWLISQHGW